VRFSVRRPGQRDVRAVTGGRETRGGPRRDRVFVNGVGGRRRRFIAGDVNGRQLVVRGQAKLRAGVGERQAGQRRGVQFRECAAGGVAAIEVVTRQIGFGV